MKVTQLEILTAFLPPARNYVYVKLHTDEGISGVGEAACSWKEQALFGALKEIERYIVGRDPLQIEQHIQAMYRHTFWRGGPVLVGAISGVEQALWDIKGKSLGVPVYELVGGRYRDKVRVYTHVHGRTPERAAEHAIALVEKGYTALKLVPFGATGDGFSMAQWKRVEATVAAIRSAVGDSVDIAVDCHGRLNPINAIEMGKRLEQFNLIFYEEPVLPENVDAMAEVAARVNSPVATGERLYWRYPFRDVLVKNAAKILQPDLCTSGGFMEGFRIAAMAEAFFATMAPHNPLSPLSTVVCLHLDTVIHNFLIQEVVTGDSERANLLTENIEVVKDGYMVAPSGPGWGVELNEEYLRAHPYQWVEPPTWSTRLPDGSIAEW